jgi:hypothetical protein
LSGISADVALVLKHKLGVRLVEIQPGLSGPMTQASIFESDPVLLLRDAAVGVLQVLGHKVVTVVALIRRKDFLLIELREGRIRGIDKESDPVVIALGPPFRLPCLCQASRWVIDIMN